MDPAERWCITILPHAAENASKEPIDEEGIAAILRGTRGSGSHLCAVFGDGSLQAITGAAATLDIPLATVLTAYAAAKTSAAAANSELDLRLEEQQRSMDADRAYGKTSVDEGGSNLNWLDFGLLTSGWDAAHALYDGDILKTLAPGGWHFYNRIDGCRHGLTASQFATPIDDADVGSSKEDALAGTKAERYDALLRAVEPVLAGT